MIKVGVLGARGRMGSRSLPGGRGPGDLTLAAGVDQGDDRAALAGCDVVVDFTHPGVVMDNLHWCISQGLDRRGRHLGFRRGQARPGREWLACAAGTGR